jgi:hypothetical protein
VLAPEDALLDARVRGERPRAPTAVKSRPHPTNPDYEYVYYYDDEETPASSTTEAHVDPGVTSNSLENAWTSSSWPDSQQSSFRPPINAMKTQQDQVQ